MRNALLAVILLFGLVLGAGCEGNNQESSASSTGSAAGITSMPQSQQQVAPTPPPPAPARSTTTQPLPSGWTYIRQTDLDATQPTVTTAE